MARKAQIAVTIISILVGVCFAFVGSVVMSFSEGPGISWQGYTLLWSGIPIFTMGCFLYFSENSWRRAGIGLLFISTIVIIDSVLLPFFQKAVLSKTFWYLLTTQGSLFSLSLSIAGALIGGCLTIKDSKIDWLHLLIILVVALLVFVIPCKYLRYDELNPSVSGSQYVRIKGRWTENENQGEFWENTETYPLKGDGWTAYCHSAIEELDYRVGESAIISGWVHGRKSVSSDDEDYVYEIVVDEAHRPRIWE